MTSNPTDTNCCNSPTPPEGHCAFFLEKKRRFCRFRPNKGQKYCAEHACTLGVQLERKRIPCPNDPKHSCYEDQLQKHLKKCSFREQPKEPYYSKGINSGEDAGEIIPEPKVSVHNASKSEILSLIEKVNKLYDEHIGNVPAEISTHGCMKEELENSTYGIQALRHRYQQASLIGLMERRELLKSGCSFVELGAGKGQLSHWVQRATAECKDTTFTLIDRSTTRYKCENVHKYDEDGPKFERLRIDLEHLNMSKVGSLTDRQLVAMGKHLCGAATDLALRCLIETLNPKEEVTKEETTKEKATEEEPPAKKLKQDGETPPRLPGGVVIALCCHHQCAWRPYVGKAFLQRAGLTARDFQLLTSISSWATCAWRGWRDVPEGQRGEGGQLSTDSRQPAEKQEEEEDEHSVEQESEQTSSQIQSLLELGAKEREEIGRRCKRLLDWGRVDYLQIHGLHSCLRQYVQDMHTPENVALIATP